MSDSNLPGIRTAVIRDVIQLASEKYVYPEIGEKIARHIQAKLENGDYDDVTQKSALAQRLTRDLRSISNDRHWCVAYDPQRAADGVDPESVGDDPLARYVEMARKNNYGFECVERLKGNVGYIDLRYFYPSEYGGETAVAARNLLMT